MTVSSSWGVLWVCIQNVYNFKIPTLAAAENYVIVPISPPLFFTDNAGRKKKKQFVWLLSFKRIVGEVKTHKHKSLCSPLMRRGEGCQSSKEICLIHRRYVYSWEKLHHVKKIKVLLSPFSCTGRSQRCQNRKMGCVSLWISYSKSIIKKPAQVIYKQDKKGLWQRRKGCSYRYGQREDTFPQLSSSFSMSIIPRETFHCPESRLH